MKEYDGPRISGIWDESMSASEVFGILAGVVVLLVWFGFCFGVCHVVLWIIK